jgi:hypothetical protein
MLESLTFLALRRCGPTGGDRTWESESELLLRSIAPESDAGRGDATVHVARRLRPPTAASPAPNQ